MWEMQKVKVNVKKKTSMWAEAPLPLHPSGVTSLPQCQALFACFDTQVNQEGLSMQSRNPTGEEFVRGYRARSGV